jgi:Family of unknown function (DUF5687)
MISTFLTHSYKKFTRSVSFEKELAKGIFMGLLALMVVGYSLALGFALDGIIRNQLHQPDSLGFVNKMLLYYFVAEFVMRYFMQNVPALDVQPYLHLPIKRSSITHYLLSKSILHVFNASVLLIFTPFALTVVAKQWGTSAAFSWLASLIFLSLCTHYLVIYYKKKLDDSLLGMAALILVFGSFAAADYYQWFKFSNVSSFIFNRGASSSILVILAIALFAFLYYLNYGVIVNGMYAEDWSSEKDSATEWGKYSDWQFLRGFGTYGEWISLELKLILRNKRPRSFVLLSGLLLLYGLIFYRGDEVQKMPGFALFVGMFITGAFMINYGQLLYSWQGGHFDFTFTRPISVRQFIESKYWLLCAATLAAFVLSLPYAYFGWHIILAHLVMMIFNMGINVFIIMNMAMWGPQKIDLTKGSTFNYEGVGAAQWIMAIPIMLAPYVIYLPFKLMFSTQAGLLAVGVAGLIGIALRPYLITLTTKRFTNKKYEIAAGFRKE